MLTDPTTVMGGNNSKASSGNGHDERVAALEVTPSSLHFALVENSLNQSSSPLPRAAFRKVQKDSAHNDQSVYAVHQQYRNAALSTPYYAVPYTRIGCETWANGY